MTYREIPLQPVPNQSVSFVFDSIPYTLTIESRLSNLYITIWRDGEYFIHNRALKSYAPVGCGLIMIDKEGFSDPDYSLLGSRFILVFKP